MDESELRGLVRNYQPAPEVVGHISDVSLLMIIGPTGVGKTTIINQLGLNFVPADTTRDPRPDEKDGVDYYFRKDYDQISSDIKEGRFVQVAVGPAGDFYATKDSSYPDSGWATMAIVADVISVFRHLGFKETLSAFVVPPTYDEWMRRLSIHPISQEQLKKRLDEARRSFEFALSDKETHFILNDEVESATGQLKNLLSGQIDQEREAKSREIAESLLQAIA